MTGPTRRVYAWDEAKRLSNIEKHGLDFEDAEAVFAGDHIHFRASTVAGEARRAVTGRLDDVFVTIIYVMRDGVTRIISMRRARAHERRGHQDLYGR